MLLRHSINYIRHKSVRVSYTLKFPLIIRDALTHITCMMVTNTHTQTHTRTHTLVSYRQHKKKLNDLLDDNQ